MSKANEMVWTLCHPLICRRYEQKIEKVWQQQHSQLTKVEAAAAGQGWRQRLQPTAVGSTTNTTNINQITTIAL